MAREVRHADHAPGTREDCDECVALAYEPGWYKALRDERVLARDPSLIAIPEPDQVDTGVEAREAPSTADDTSTR